MKKRFVLPASIILLALAACKPQPGFTPTPTRTPRPEATSSGSVATATDTPTEGPTPTLTPTPIGPYGPTDYPSDVDPLTGLPVEDPTVLDRIPLLVKVSNQSDAVRPQSGLSYADQVWEYQMEGYAQTRYTAVLYSQSPQIIGSVRSTRLIDVEHLVDMYGGSIVTSGSSTNRHAGGPPRINELMLAQPWHVRTINADWGFGDPWLVRISDVPRPDMSFEHTLFAVPSLIWQWLDDHDFHADRSRLAGLLFDFAVPSGGTPTTNAVIAYPGRGPDHYWDYDPTSGRWMSSTAQGSGTPPPIPDLDYLTGEQLGFENVVIVYADEYDANYIEYEGTPTLNGVHTVLAGQGDAVLLRDGMRYDVSWSRENGGGMMQFYNANGQIIAFKPGTTFFNVASDTVAPPDVSFTDGG